MITVWVVDNLLKSDCCGILTHFMPKYHVFQLSYASFQGVMGYT